MSQKEYDWQSCKWSEDTPDACKRCSGEVCGLCGAGCWNNAIGFTELPCHHNVDDRHRDGLTQKRPKKD